MEITQRAMQSILPHQIGYIIRYTIIASTYNMRMREVSNRACLLLKTLQVGAIHVHVMHFDRRLRSQVNMLTQVDIRESTTAEQADQPISAKFLIEMALHGRAPCARTISFSYGF